jgi:hypothetical protein
MNLEFSALRYRAIRDRIRAEVAIGLWEQTRPKSAPANTPVNAVGTSVSPEKNTDQNDQSAGPQ